MYLSIENIADKEFFCLNLIMNKAESDLKNRFKKEPPFTLRTFYPIMRDSILGLSYLHLNNIIHRDIKPENIMFYTENYYEIADFGLGVNLNQNE